MKPLQELLKGKVVSCQTEEEEKEFLSFMHENGYKWVDGTSLINMTCFIHGRLTCYNTNNVNNKISHSGEACYKNEGYEVITYQQFKQLINNENMETKEVKIQVPEGYEIDKENSTFDHIKFKPINKVLSYEDVAKELFKDKSAHYTDERGGVSYSKFTGEQFLDANNCTSEKQAQKLLAINKLMNVAKYLNSEWRPDWEKGCDTGIKCFIAKTSSDELIIRHIQRTNDVNIFFKSRNLAKQAIEILGEETIKLALSTDW